MIVNIIAAILVSLLIVITVCYIIDKKQRKTFLNKVMQQMQLQALDINHKAPVTALQEIIIDALLIKYGIRLHRLIIGYCGRKA